MLERGSGARPLAKFPMALAVAGTMTMIPGSDLIAFRGIKVMNFAIDRVAFVLLNRDVDAEPIRLSGFG